MPATPDLLGVPDFCFLLVSEEQEYFLIDTGFAANHLPGGDLSHGKAQTLPIALSQAGIDYHQIKNVIMTHLHWDHTAGLPWLQHASIYVQGEELKNMDKLTVVEETAYCVRNWIPLLPRFEILAGTQEIRPGLKAILTGYHSAGHQIIEINTRNGLQLIAGDALSTNEMLLNKDNRDAWNKFHQDHEQFHWSVSDRTQIKDYLQSKRLDTMPVSPFTRFEELIKTNNYNQIWFAHDPKIKSHRKESDIYGKIPKDNLEHIPSRRQQLL